MQASSIEAHILSIVCSVFDAYSAVLFLPEEDASESCSLAGYFSLGSKIDESARIVAGQGLVGWIIRNHEVLCVPNFDHYNSKLGYYREREEESIKAFMGAPISCGGVLCLDSKRKYAFSEKDNKVLHLFAELIAKLRVSHSEKDFLADIPNYFAELAVLQDLPMRSKRWSEYLSQYMTTFVTAVHFDYAAFCTLDAENKSYDLEYETAPLILGREPAVFSINHGIVGWVFKNGQPVISEGLEETPAPLLFGKNIDTSAFCAVMCLPILVNNEPRAVLCLAGRSPRRIDESLRSFVRLAIGQMTFYLENLYLRTRLGGLLPEAVVHSGRGVRRGS